MKSILNKLHTPIKVPLPQGRVLHLGPNQNGRINDHAVDHPPLQRLVEEGSVEIADEGAHDTAGAPAGGKAQHANTHGYHHREGHVRGDR